MLLQRVLNHIQDLFAVSGDGMIMIVGRDFLEKAGTAAGDILQKSADVQPGTDVELGPDNAVSAMINEYILDAAAEIDTQGQLFGGFFV